MDTQTKIVLHNRVLESDEMALDLGGVVEEGFVGAAMYVPERGSKVDDAVDSYILRK